MFFGGKPPYGPLKNEASQKIRFFFDILLVNRYIGKVSIKHFNIFNFYVVPKSCKVIWGP